jgi:Uma2 family endonuclease
MTIAVIGPMEATFEIDLRPLSEISERDFVALCEANPELRFERTAEGDIIVMSPEGGESGNRSQRIGAQLAVWCESDGTGAVFGSSTGFRFPNGATRSPDAAWVRLSRLATLTPAEKRGFLPLCPDFVIELRSPTDRLAQLEAKMAEYLANGAELGWLIDPDSRTVQVYRPGRDVERLAGMSEMAGAPELPGFVLDLAKVWEPGF